MFPIREFASRVAGGACFDRGGRNTRIMASASGAPSIPLVVHEPPGASRVLGSISPGELIGTLEDALGQLCRESAALLDADVVTVYELEEGKDGDSLVVRGNVGFPSEVVGNLRLRVGDGVVGWVAECLRPISIVCADQDPRFKPVRGIGEEQFPILLAFPIVHARRSAGVMVVQRVARDFATAEVRLAGVLAEAAGQILAAANRGQPGALVASAVSLEGRPLVGGFGIGRLEIIPTAESLARPDEPPIRAVQIHGAFARIERDLAAVRTKLAPAGARVRDALGRLELMLSDARFRERALAAGAGHLAGVARDYARTPDPDPSQLERAGDLEELCVLLHVTATGSRLRRAGQIWATGRFGGFLALAAARNAVAVVLDRDSEVTDDAVTIAHAARVPLLTDVGGLFSWTRPGDLLVVDADRGMVRVNPSARGILAARAR
jgi:phosphotransferase system enzyme I (PtsP)